MSKHTYVKAPTAPQAMPAATSAIAVELQLLNQLSEELSGAWCRLSQLIDMVGAHADRLIGPTPAEAACAPVPPPSSGVVFQLLDGVRIVHARITSLEEQFARLARL